MILSLFKGIFSSEELIIDWLKVLSPKINKLLSFVKIIECLAPSEIVFTEILCKISIGFSIKLLSEIPHWKF